MEIQINDNPVDFALTGEKTIKEILDSITEWTNQRNLIFTEAQINNNVYSIGEVPDISLDDIKTLNCFVQSKADVVISSLNAGLEYSERIHSYFNKSINDNNIDSAEIKNIAAGIDWMVEVINKISDMLGLNVYEVRFKDNLISNYIEKTIEFKNNIKLKSNDDLLKYIRNKKEIFSEISGIFKMFLLHENMKSLIIQSIDSPDVLVKSILEIKKEIPLQIKNLEDIAVAYQTGKDDIALEKMQLFIDFIFNYSRTCCQIAPVFEIDLENIIIDGISLAGKNVLIQDLLNQIIRVMENNDIISLSDILEYEMKSSLENLEVYIDSLTGMIGKDI